MGEGARCSLPGWTKQAGRALAGPLCAPRRSFLPADDPEIPTKLFEVRDSKQLSAFDREKLAPLIRELALDFSIAWIEADEIDDHRVWRAPAERFFIWRCKACT